MPPNYALCGYGEIHFSHPKIIDGAISYDRLDSLPAPTKATEYTARGPRASLYKEIVADSSELLNHGPHDLRLDFLGYLAPRIGRRGQVNPRICERSAFANATAKTRNVTKHLPGCFLGHIHRRRFPVPHYLNMGSEILNKWESQVP